MTYFNIYSSHRTGHASCNRNQYTVYGIWSIHSGVLNTTIKSLEVTLQLNECMESGPFNGGLLSSFSNKNEFVDSYVMAEDNLIKTDSQGQHARACVCMFNGRSTKVYAL